jgi:hypothetical protein
VHLVKLETLEAAYLEAKRNRGGLARVPPPSTPPDDARADRFRERLLPSPELRRLGIRMHLSRPRLGVHSSLRPACSLTLPNRALSVGFTDGISLAGTTQAISFDLLPLRDTLTLWIH